MQVHDYSVSQLQNKAVGKDHLVSNLVDDAIANAHAAEQMACAQFCCLVCGVFTP